MIDIIKNNLRIERNARNLYNAWELEWDSTPVSWKGIHKYLDWLEYRVRRNLETHDAKDTRFMLRYIAVHHLSPLVTCDIIDEFKLND